MRHPIDELFEKYPALKTAPKSSGFWEHMDRRNYSDEMEYLETPGLSLEKQFAVVDSLSKLNHQSGYTAIVLKHLASLVSEFPKNRTLKILDIGVGGGGLLKAIAQWSQKKKIHAELWGMDISQDFIERARKKLEAENIAVNFINTDACRMKTVADNTFDVVLSNYMVHHIRDIHKVADFLAEVYRTGKSWLIVDFERKVMGPLMMKMAVAPFFPPQVLIDDGIKSIRRAYRASEINIILNELQKEGRAKGMKARPLTILPYWILKGRKI
jgi:ubiquinone/menaquinone biosynthesis C-methylase UbiE